MAARRAMVIQRLLCMKWSACCNNRVSQYWSIAHGTDPGEVTQDEEGMQTMRQLGLNMAFLIKSIRLGLQQFGSPKIQEELVETHYIR